MKWTVEQVRLELQVKHLNWDERFMELRTVQGEAVLVCTLCERSEPTIRKFVAHLYETRHSDRVSELEDHREGQHHKPVRKRLLSLKGNDSKVALAQFPKKQRFLSRSNVTKEFEFESKEMDGKGEEEIDFEESKLVLKEGRELAGSSLLDSDEGFVYDWKSSEPDRELVFFRVPVRSSRSRVCFRFREPLYGESLDSGSEQTCPISPTSDSLASLHPSSTEVAHDHLKSVSFSDVPSSLQLSQSRETSSDTGLLSFDGSSKTIAPRKHHLVKSSRKRPRERSFCRKTSTSDDEVSNYEPHIEDQENNLESRPQLDSVVRRNHKLDLQKRLDDALSSHDLSVHSDFLKIHRVLQFSSKESPNMHYRYVIICRACHGQHVSFDKHFNAVLNHVRGMTHALSVSSLEQFPSSFRPGDLYIPSSDESAEPFQGDVSLWVISELDLLEKCFVGFPKNLFKSIVIPNDHANLCPSDSVGAISGLIGFNSVLFFSSTKHRSPLINFDKHPLYHAIGNSSGKAFIRFNSLHLGQESTSVEPILLLLKAQNPKFGSKLPMYIGSITCAHDYLLSRLSEFVSKKLRVYPCNVDVSVEGHDGTLLNLQQTIGECQFRNGTVLVFCLNDINETGRFISVSQVVSIPQSHRVSSNVVAKPVSDHSIVCQADSNAAQSSSTDPKPGDLTSNECVKQSATVIQDSRGMTCIPDADGTLILNSKLIQGTLQGDVSGSCVIETSISDVNKNTPADSVLETLAVSTAAPNAKLNLCADFNAANPYRARQGDSFGHTESTSIVPGSKSNSLFDLPKQNIPETQVLEALVELESSMNPSSAPKDN
jgi:hypothetical protein